MGTYQAARAPIETAIIDALADLDPPVPVYTDNVAVDPMDADSTWATISLAWGQTLRGGITGYTMEQLRGSLVVTVYGPKQTGPSALQDINLAVTDALITLCRTERTSLTDVQVSIVNANGPRFGVLADSPHAWVRSDYAVQVYVPTTVSSPPAEPGTPPAA